jgi:Subtilase family
VPIPRLTVLAVAAAACGVLAYAAASSASTASIRSPLAGASLSRLSLERTGRFGDELRITSRSGSWRSAVRGVLQLRFSWLECDLKGNRCSALPGLRTRAIVPPQEPRLVTLRGALTATTPAGTSAVTTGNFYYDLGGVAFEAGRSRYVHAHPQYGPEQLRNWYGVGSDQDGAGQTIVIPAPGRQHGLRRAVDHFSAHYGLPRTCRRQREGCFQLVLSRVGKGPTYLSRIDETEADVEWAHTIAPEARIVVLEFDFDHVAALLGKIRRLGLAGRASVVSNSWCAPCMGHHAYGRHVVYPHIARGCHLRHLVCVQASGNDGFPGSTPSNSRYVLAAGGTTFRASRDDAMRTEIPWRPSGSGETDMPVPRPAWQRTIHAGCSHRGGKRSCAKRAVPDVTATAANVPVFRPTRTGFSWSYFHGTSLSTPLWAGLIALTDQALQREGQQPVGVDELHRALYRGYAAAGLDDIRPEGWDWATGLGSPRAGIVDALTRAIERYRLQR